MIVSTRGAATGIALALAAALTGCSGSSGPNPSSPPPADAGSGRSGTPADAATRHAVSTAFSTFFSPTSTPAQSEVVLQHGSVFSKTLADEAKSTQAQHVTATVSAVSLTSADVAAVTFTLTSGGSPLVSNTSGYAVREGGSWKVAAQTFCSLLQLEGNAPAACKESSITTLPG
jgi:hypothetical protein